MASIPIMKPTATKDRDQVYVAAVPLRATRGPAQLLMSTAYSLNFWDLQHFLVLIKPSSPRNSQVLVFDFQPKDPENIFVALAALSGQAIPGLIEHLTGENFVLEQLRSATSVRTMSAN